MNQTIWLFGGSSCQREAYPHCIGKRFYSQGIITDDEIVVYCTDPACVASQYAYRWLKEAGYNDVRRYAGGVSDWAAAGYELDGSGPGDSPGGAFFLPDIPSPG